MVCPPIGRDNPQALGGQIMLFLICTMISSEELAYYGASGPKGLVS